MPKDFIVAVLPGHSNATMMALRPAQTTKSMGALNRYHHLLVYHQHGETARDISCIPIIQLSRILTVDKSSTEPTTLPVVQLLLQDFQLRPRDMMIDGSI